MLYLKVIIVASLFCLTDNCKFSPRNYTPHLDTSRSSSSHYN